MSKKIGSYHLLQLVVVRTVLHSDLPGSYSFKEAHALRRELERKELLRRQAAGFDPGNRTEIEISYFVQTD